MKTLDLRTLDSHEHECPLCDGTSFTTLASHDRNLLGIRTVGCRGCGLIQTNPRPSREGLDRFYRDHYRLYYQGAAAPDANYIANLNKDVRLAATASDIGRIAGIDQTASVLDFGCGEGSLFAALRKAGFTGTFHGVELNAKFGEFASRFGGATVTNSIHAGQAVDLVIINHVLEHLDDPIGRLRELRRALREGGALFIDVPDAQAYTGIQDLHIAHIFHFTERTLRGLVERAGFDIESAERHRPPFHPPSIRAVARARAGTGTYGAAPTSSPASERDAWRAVRRAGRALNTVRLRLREVPGARRLVVAGRRLIGGLRP